MPIWKRKDMREAAGEQRDVGIQQADALLGPPALLPPLSIGCHRFHKINEAAAAE